jgi:hypothetical protein
MAAAPLHPLPAAPALPAPVLPAIVAHADWSVSPKHRWMVRARLADGGRYRASAPELVGDLPSLLERLQGPVLLGLDLPIGLPLAYARRAGIGSFMPWLRQLGRGRSKEFFDVAAEKSDVSVERPFYPARPGGKKKCHLTDGLELDDVRLLYRRCDRSPERPPAAPMFWTIGPQQVGKAALSAWREVLIPALRGGGTAIWPFDGELPALLGSSHVVVAETYPGEIYRHLGVDFRPSGSKRLRKGDPAARRANGGALLAAAARSDVDLDPGLREAIGAGFDRSHGGDDGFDATVGLLGMINVLRGNRPSGEPDDPDVRGLEGWILGQAAT